MGIWKRRGVASIALLALVLSACTGERVGEQLTTEEKRKRDVGKLFGEGAFTFGVGRDRDSATDTSGSGIGVNSFLWRASLDTLAFMPLASADPFGGVIISDWYAPPESPDERFKVSVFILGRELRSDGIRASVHKQLLDDGRGWKDAAVADATATKIEDAILTRARELRVVSAQ